MHATGLEAAQQDPRLRAPPQGLGHPPPPSVGVRHTQVPPPSGRQGQAGPLRCT